MANSIYIIINMLIAKVHFYSCLQKIILVYQMFQGTSIFDLLKFKLLYQHQKN